MMLPVQWYAQRQRSGSHNSNTDQHQDQGDTQSPGDKPHPLDEQSRPLSLTMAGVLVNSLQNQLKSPTSSTQISLTSPKTEEITQEFTSTKPIEDDKCQDPLIESQDTTVESQDIAVESQETTVESQDIAVESQDTAVKSQDIAVESQDTTVESQDTTVESQDTTVESQDTTVESQDTTVESQDTSSEHQDTATVESRVNLDDKSLEDNSVVPTGDTSEHRIDDTETNPEGMWFRAVLAALDPTLWAYSV